MNKISKVRTKDGIKSPLVSISIITYNQKEYLRECIESILNQDYSNIEIIVADDCSIDGTQQMLKSYESKYPDKFILKLSKNNKGITKNSNLAHFSCTGEYIAWMGGDDLMLPGKISAQVQYMENNPECIISYHALDVFESESNNTLFIRKQGVKKPINTVREVIKHGCFIGACSAMVRRKSTPEKGFDERIPYASDWLYWAESLVKGGEVHYIDKLLGRYRRHDANITSNNGSFKTSVDQLNSCNILLLDSPKYHNEILYRYQNLIKGMRIRDKPNYKYYLQACLKFRFEYKAIVAFTIFIFSFKRIKL
ncbi:MAG: glycosyltransferase [Methylococcaceae bacterium]